MDLHPGGKLCPQCKKWNPSDASVCAYCAKRPFTWRSEFRLLIVLLVLCVVGLLAAEVVSSMSGPAPMRHR